jgi:VWFA-related protein
MLPRRAAVVAALAFSGLAAPELRAQAVREKVAVEVIDLRLTARDRTGQMVGDLTPADLSLTVDGRSVAIDTLTGPSTPAASDDSADPGSSASRRIRTFLFVDEGATVFIDRRVVCEELERLLSTEGPRSRREVMVGRFDGSGLEIACPWTSQPDQAISALRQVRGAPSFNRMPSASESSGSGTPAIWFQSYGERLHQGLLEALAAFPDDAADRQLVIVSGGTALMRPMDLIAVLRCEMSPAERTRLQLLDSDVSRAHAREIERATFALWSRAANPLGHALTMSDVVAKALERNVAIVPVAAEATHRGIDLGFEQRMRRLDRPPVAAAGDGRMTARTSVTQAMSEIAESTGTEPILVPGRTGDRLPEIENRPTYTLTFRDPAADHRYHQIELASRRPGVTVQYRRGYRLPTDDERMLDAVIARLVAPSPGPDPLNARVSLSSGGSSEGRTALLSVRIEPPRETAPPLQRRLVLVAVGEDASGQRTEPVSWSETAHAAGGEPGVYALTTRLGARPGDFRWSLAVRDEDTGLTSFVLVLPGP